MEKHELYHHGVKGMKWGVRRTPAQLGHKPLGKRISKRTKELITSLKKKKQARDQAKEVEKQNKILSNKPISKMSNAELKTRIEQLQLQRTALDLQKQVSTLNPKRISLGKKFLNEATNVIVPAVTDASRRTLTDYLTKMGKDTFGLNVQDEMSVLKKEVDKLELQRRKAQAKYDINNIGKLDPMKSLSREADEWSYRKKVAEGKKAEMDLEDKMASRAKKTESGATGRTENSSSSNKKEDSNRNTNTSKSKEKEPERWDGDVVGEGTSSRKSSTNTSKKPDNYYDPIDGYGREVKDTPVSSLPAAYRTAGQMYIAGYLEDKKK